jgi:predicted alpha/beta superfamily hydrolase
MAEWKNYLTSKAGDGHSVMGDLRVLEKLESPQLGNHRDILVYLPPTYDSEDRRYPVLYLHDGQNLFDEKTSFAGEWQVDETMESLSQEGIEAIIVGIPNSGEKRLDEYSPFHEPKMGGGQGNDYLSFIVQTVKPLVDASFRTLSGREYTGIMGSSMGGLISLYAFFHHPDVFGMAGVMSPSFWFAKGEIYAYVQQASRVPGKIYMDAGTREHGDGLGRLALLRSHSRRYYAGVRRMQRLLVKKGYRPWRELMYIEEKWARHEEGAWARRFPSAIRFLLGD